MQYCLICFRDKECTYLTYLEECNPKRDPSDDSQVGLHHMGHPRKAALQQKENIQNGF